MRGKPLILQSEGYDTEMIKFLRQNKLPVKADFRIEVDATCHAYVEKGFGFCIAPLMTFHCNPRRERVAHRTCLHAYHWPSDRLPRFYFSCCQPVQRPHYQIYV